MLLLIAFHLRRFRKLAMKHDRQAIDDAALTVGV
jgi:hypothetical protein